MLKRTTSIVISLHLIFIIMLLFSQNRALPKRTHHIQVRTVQPAARPIATTTRSQAGTSRPTNTSRPKPNASSKKPALVESKKPAPSKPSSAPSVSKPIPSTSKKPIVVDKGKPTTPSSTKPAAPNTVVDWKEIDQVLAKIEEKEHTSENVAIAAPKFLQIESSSFSPLMAEIGETTQDATGAVASFLHDSLHLPEVGEVKVELLIKKDGTIANVVIMRSESEKNKRYLQTHLPLLRFPMDFEQDKTWTLTFSNEI